MIVTELNQEWDRLVETTDVAVWAATCPALAACNDLDDVLAATKGEPDEVLGFLIGEHRTGNDLAGRAVLQSMLPKICAMLRWRRARFQSDPVADMVSQMWVLIDRYPLEARPHQIAANLALDTLKNVRRQWDADHEPVDEAGHSAAWQRTAASERRQTLTADRVLAIALAHGWISERTHTILSAVYDEGLSGREAAERFDVSVDTIRYHCSSAIRKSLAPHRLELAEA